jgi:RHS repeat-associated protein
MLKKTVHRHSIGGFVTYSRTVTGGTTVTKLTTILKDHLGSTDLLWTSTWNGVNFANPTPERQSFDTWGERRAPETQVAFRQGDGDAFRTGPENYERGYTGHEQLDDSGLIHMNGRLYDPELGRMLSPDPVVQVPEYSQNFNRYSYVMNNPLNLTDPSGFSFFTDVLGGFGLHTAFRNWSQENWRTVVVIVVVAVLVFTGVGAGIAAGIWGAFGGSALVTGSALSYAVTGAFIGAVQGGLSAALNGGDLGDVLRGAVIGGVSGALTGSLHNVGGNLALDAANVVGHGVVGGASNVAMGGKFQDGFLSAAASATTSVSGLTNPETSSLNIVGRTAVASIAGGTASALGGGKFANGALTGAMTHLLNAEAGRIKQQSDPGRGLTSGEKELLKENFGNSLDPSRIRVHNFGYLPKMRICTPDGTIYAPGDTYSEDYSKEEVMSNTGTASRALFIHEATHAYQFQSGVNVALVRVLLPIKNANYNYFPFPNNKNFQAYGIEQQAMLVEDYYRVRNGALQVWDGNRDHPAPSADSYKKILPFNK